MFGSRGVEVMQELTKLRYRSIWNFYYYL